MKKLCLICSGSVKDINIYSHKCKKCGFYFSTLSSGYGQDVKGLEHIRKQNFKKILNLLFSKHNFYEFISGNLNSLDINNSSRFNNLFDSVYKRVVFSIFCFLFFFFQKFLPKDIMFVFFKHK